MINKLYKKLYNLIINIIIVMISTIITVTIIEITFSFIIRDAKSIKLKNNLKTFLKAYECSYKLYHYIPNSIIPHSTSEYDVVYTIDKYGYRNQEDYDYYDHNIVVIGDSFAFGFGVGDNEVFSRKIQSYNAGLWGLSFNYHLEVLKNILTFQTPKKVIWTIYPSHIISMTESQWKEICPGDKEIELNNIFLYFLNKTLPFITNLYTFKFLKNRLKIKEIYIRNNKIVIRKDCYFFKEIILYDKKIKNNQYTSNNDVNKKICQEMIEAYRKFDDIVNTLMDISNEKGIQIIPLIVPSKLQLRMIKDWTNMSNIDPYLPNKKIKEILIKNGVNKSQIIDLLNVFIKRDDIHKIYYKNDAHWTSYGHAVVAEILNEYK